MESDYQTQLRGEFDRQVGNLVGKGFPEIANMGTREFLDLLEPLWVKITDLAPVTVDVQKGFIPFLIVVKNELIPAEVVLPLIEVKGKRGYVDMHPVEPERFNPIDGLDVPKRAAYLAINIETGQETLNVTPYAALNELKNDNRSPLTIDEGVALLTQFPEVLIDKKNYNSFYLLGSRCGDKRVPAIWLSYKKPRLGWCWEKNPHTWLGSASCEGRVGL